MSLKVSKGQDISSNCHLAVRNNHKIAMFHGYDREETGKEQPRRGEPIMCRILIKRTLESGLNSSHSDRVLLLWRFHLLITPPPDSDS